MKFFIHFVYYYSTYGLLNNPKWVKFLVVHIAWRTIQFLNFFEGNLLLYNIYRWTCLWILHPYLFNTLFECRVSGAKDCGIA